MSRNDEANLQRFNRSGTTSLHVLVDISFIAVVQQPVARCGECWSFAIVRSWQTCSVVIATAEVQIRVTALPLVACDSMR